MSQAILRHLPPVGQLLEHPRIAALTAGDARIWVTRLVQREVDAERRRMLERGGETPGGREALIETLVARVEERVVCLRGPAMTRVINATGIVVHTNLGRSLYPERAADWMRRAALHNCDLEMDLVAGRRGHRGRAVEEKLALLTGAEDALVVNNNAAALWLAVRTAAGGGRVVLSRGEVVAIGGSFRLHTIVAETGCELVEVGTTNRTTLDDYAAALTPGAVVLKVHRSNFALKGFTEEVGLAHLAGLCRERGHVLVYDAGSGLLEPVARFGIDGESTVEADLAAGPDLVTCSGDKLFGGGQAGIVLGRRDRVAAMRAHPMRRAFRVDKTTLAALDGVVTHYIDGDHGAAVPTLAFLGRSVEDLERRCTDLGEALADVEPEGWTRAVEADESQVGGGAGAESVQPSRLLIWRGPRIELERVHRLLRTGDPAVVARIAQDGLAVDLRAVRDEELPELENALRAAWRRLAGDVEAEVTGS